MPDDIVILASLSDIALLTRETPSPVFTPKRLDRALSQRCDTGRHASFLERANAGGSGDETRRRAALGAYLVARLIDRLMLDEGTPDAAEGLRWQRDSTLHYLRDLPSEDSETPFLVRVAAAVEAESSTALPQVRVALNEYASYLEFEGRLDEALDSLRLAATTWHGAVPTNEFAALALFAGRVNRLLGRWECATDSYAAAEDAAADGGDTASVLRARLGRASVLRAIGQIVLAQALIEDVIDDAGGQGYLAPVLGLAYADLGAVLAQAGRPIEAIQATYESYRHTPDRSQRIRILGELGAGLAELGAYGAARAAFELVVASTTGQLARARAWMGLMDTASAEGDRIGFERSRSEARALMPTLPAGVAADLGFRTAAGLARFGQFARARAVWRETLELANDRGLDDWSMTIRRVLDHLDECRSRGGWVPDAPRTTPEVAALAADLDQLASLARA